MAPKYTIRVVLLLLLISLQLIKLGHGSGVHTSIHCLEFEREALLGFAKGFNQTEYPFSSWAEKDCCRWGGVYCDNTTGHIIKLVVRGVSHGKINQSLLGLKHLNYLVLGGDINIPPFIGDFKELRFLDLTTTNYGGTIPQQLENLSSLQYLYLYGMSLPLIINNAHWLSRLTSLQELEMKSVSFDKASGWLDALNMLPSLRSILLIYCEFGSFPLSLAHVNFTSVLSLSLYSASTKSRIPSWLFHLSNLQNLDLSYTDFQGPIPVAIGNLTSLKVLLLRRALHSNNLPDWITSLNLPDWITGLKNLIALDLSMNSLSGAFPKGVGQLSQLSYLDLSYNSLEGKLTEEHFTNLTRLKALIVGFNNLVLNVSSDWVPPFQLEYINMRSCLVGPKFPMWLRTQRTLAELGIPNSGILGSIPKWFWNLTSLIFVDLSNNVIGSTIPHFPSNILALYLSNTSLQGPIPPNISKIFPNLKALTLGMNDLNGSIPLSLCDLVNLTVLDISNNNLSGELPSCEKHFPKSIAELLLSNNNLSGGIPRWIRFSSHLIILHLSNNNMSGDFPLALWSCEELITLDIGGNRFSGSIPTWIAKSLPRLKRLRLRSNLFAGEIPTELFQIKNLHVLDLSQNNFFGVIPRSFASFLFLQPLDHQHGPLDYALIISYGPRNFSASYSDEMILGTKGREYMYALEPLELITIIDLSENNLSGCIPEELISLPTLMSLNLSSNHLTGEISKKIGNMLLLESLDLSRNELSGAIPPTLNNLSFLSSLNLSYNNLSGRIPTGKQLDTINDSFRYIGNPFLCGVPLIKTCEGDGTIYRVPKDTDGDGNPQASEDEILWFYLGIASGYIVGFWTILGVLLLNKTWRIVYFQFIDNSYDRIYVAILLSFRRLKRRFLCG